MSDISCSIQKNPLESDSIWKLIRKFAIPATISGLVNSLYNIVDQIFIGQSIGPLGIAATNVAFPLVIIMTALSMMIGIGGASQFSLKLGQNDKEKAGRYRQQHHSGSYFGSISCRYCTDIPAPAYDCFRCER